jgi:hypothetical protein
VFKEERENFLVARNLWPELPGELTPMVLFLATNRQKVPFLWNIRLPGEEGRHDEWSASALEAAKRREKLSRVLGKRALKTFHPRSFNARLLAGVTWSDQSGTHCRTAAPAFC